MAKQERPLSPHLGIYRWQVGNGLSILHRLSGVVLSCSAVLLTVWVAALAMGPDAYVTFAAWLRSTPGLLASSVVTLCFFYHLCNGIRHLFWDAGYGFEIPVARASGISVVAGAIALNLAFWLLILSGGGR